MPSSICGFLRSILSLRQMIMTIRAIVCVSLLFAPVLQAQDSALERTASDFRSSGIGLTEMLLRFAHQQNVRVAVEYADRDSLNQPIAVSLHNNTVRQGLNAILRNGRGYSWRMRNGIIEIRNEHGSKRADKQLDTVIPTFEISNSASAKAASAMLWMNLRMKLDPSMKGFAISVGEGVDRQSAWDSLRTVVCGYLWRPQVLPMDRCWTTSGKISDAAVWAKESR